MGDTAGATANSPGFVFPVIANETVCPASSAGPLEMAVAHGLTVCGPALS